MQSLFPVAIVAALGLTLGAPAAARAEAPAAQRMGAYVVSDDLDRAAGFYTALFGRAPEVRAPGLVGFDVAGGLYAVASRAMYAPGAVRGGNVAPYIKVADIDAWFRHVQAVAPERLVTKAVVREGPFAMIKVADPDGNVLEFYAITPPR